MRRRSVLKAAAASTVVLGAGAAHAQEFPARPLRLVVPYGAGGSPDRLGRAFADALAAELRQTVVVVNMPGAAGNIGHQNVVTAPADGYTLLMTTTGSMAINPTLYRKLAFKQEDFTPIVGLGVAPAMLVTRTAAPWKSTAELVADARANPGKLTFASTGIGTTNHLAGVMFQAATRTQLLHVPYKEAGQAITGTVSGETDLLFYQPSTLLPLVTGGKLRPLAVTSRARSRLVPDVPTLQEAGLADFDMTVWAAVVAHHGIPPAARAKLVQAAERAVRSPAVVSAIRDNGDDRLEIAAADLPKFFAAETVRWGAIVKSSGSSLD